MSKKNPSQELIRYLFLYREDGNLLRKVKPNPKANSMTPIGEPVGRPDERGYRATQVEGKQHKIHKLIYIYHYGEVDEDALIDHIDGNPANNRIENLRVATLSQNICNRKMPSHNKSGVKGVSRHKKSGKWIVGVAYNKKKYHGGLFNTLEEAENRAKQLRAEVHGEFTNHG
jgi:hypothetical protein